MPNLTDELSAAKERRLNQFGTAVLVWCDKSVKYDRVCRTFVELNLGSTHGAPSESDVAPVSLQSRTYSVLLIGLTAWDLGNLLQPIRSATQIWVVTRHQYEISSLVSQSSFRGETSSGVAKCRLFSQDTEAGRSRPLSALTSLHENSAFVFLQQPAVLQILDK